MFRWVRRRMAVRLPHITKVTVEGAEHVREALEKKQGVLITPNHSVHGDPMIVYEAADRFGSALYFMAAWQVLGLVRPLRRAFLRMHGCFSVDREGTDRKALYQAVDILKSKRQPLVIFPEGEVYHCNERVTPFREGPAAIAVMAARKADREIVVVPCGLRYHYIENPLPDLLTLMDEVETAMFWRPRPDMALPERVYRVAAGMLGLKELEYMGAPQEGTLPQRIERLIDVLLRRIEEKYQVGNSDTSTPERIKQGRQRAINAMVDLTEGTKEYRACADDLDDLYIAVQLFSYPGDYVAQHPSVDRLAETLDKFEEDILDLPTATVRAHRRATVVLGEAVPVPKEKKRNAAAELTRTLERRVQQLLDSVELPSRSFELVAPASPASSTDETALA